METVQFEQGNLKDIRIAIQNKLNELKDLGVAFRVGNATYEEHSASFKLHLTIANAPPKEETDLIYFANMMKIDLTKTHPRYKLVGYNRKARKLPFIITDSHKPNDKYLISFEEAIKLFEKTTNNLLKGVA
tara:strand:+ start:236 stop:628 length:393 start_codon:yes stop_codon:yes gene_type:complete